jgi:4'-phosphopantetheinyl transferase EntD
LRWLHTVGGSGAGKAALENVVPAIRSLLPVAFHSGNIYLYTSLFLFAAVKSSFHDTPSASSSYRQLQAQPIQFSLQGEVTCWLSPFDADIFDPRSFLEHGIALPPSIARSVQRRQAEFFHGRRAAEAALKALGIAGATIGQGRQREPVWPEGIIGSITHNRSMAGAIALRYGQASGVGMDIETLIDAQACDAVIQTAVDAAELSALRRLGLPMPLLLTIVFSAKEAFYKAAFPQVQRFFDFSALRFADLDLRTGRIGFIQHEPLSDGLVAGTRREICIALLGHDTVLTCCLL